MTWTVVEMKERFSKLASAVSTAAGTWQASLAAFLIIAVWVCGGFYFGFLDETYQLVINSITTVITFLMVFLIQGAQNRESRAIQLKLDELICAVNNRQLKQAACE